MTLADDLPEVLTLAEAAEAMRMSEQAARRLAQRHQFPGVIYPKRGNRWLVNKQRFLEYLGGDS